MSNFPEFYEHNRDRPIHESCANGILTIGLTNTLCKTLLVQVISMNQSFQANCWCLQRFSISPIPPPPSCAPLHTPSINLSVQFLQSCTLQTCMAYLNHIQLTCMNQLPPRVTIFRALIYCDYHDVRRNFSSHKT